MMISKNVVRQVRESCRDIQMKHDVYFPYFLQYNDHSNQIPGLDHRDVRARLKRTTYMSFDPPRGLIHVLPVDFNCFSRNIAKTSLTDYDTRRVAFSISLAILHVQKLIPTASETNISSSKLQRC